MTRATVASRDGALPAEGSGPLLVRPDGARRRMVAQLGRCQGLGFLDPHRLSKTEVGDVLESL